MLGSHLRVVRLFRHDRRQDGRDYHLRRSQKPASQLLARSRLWPHGGEPVWAREVWLSRHEGQKGTREARQGRASEAALWDSASPRRRQGRESSRTVRAIREDEVTTLF